MRVNLLFGFLGSGKTTLVKRLLEERGRDAKTAVIVNEFGEVGIDGQILRGANIDMVELNSGCLCCTLKGSLMLAVEELRQKAGVERVIVEATGVAQPGELTETLTDPTMRTEVDIGPLVTVVDAHKFSRLMGALGEFYIAQIENADIVILNKADLAAPGALEEAKREVLDINPGATVLFADHCDVDSSYLLEGEFSGLLAQRAGDRHDRQHEHDHDHDHGSGHHHDGGHRHPHAPAESFVLDATGGARREALEGFFRSLPDNVWRAKGFMRVDGEPSLVQYTMGQLEIAAAAPPPALNMVFIGRDMDRSAISAGFEQAQG